MKTRHPRSRRPLQSREDWVRGIVGVVNALGWGVWNVEGLEAVSDLGSDTREPRYLRLKVEARCLKPPPARP